MGVTSVGTRGKPTTADDAIPEAGTVLPARISTNSPAESSQAAESPAPTRWARKARAPVGSMTAHTRVVASSSSARTGSGASSPRRVWARSVSAHAALLSRADQSVSATSSTEVGVQPFGGLPDGGARADMRLRCPRNTVGDKDNDASVRKMMHREIVLTWRAVVAVQMSALRHATHGHGVGGPAIDHHIGAKRQRTVGGSDRSMVPRRRG